MPGTNAVPVRLPLPQAFSVPGRHMWVLSIDELNEFRHAAGFGNDVHPEPAPEWDAAAEGVEHGWDAWGEAPQYVPPPQQHYGYGGEYVPRAEFQQLQQQVGGIRTDLQLANDNINLLSGNMQSLFSFWQPGTAPSSSSGPSQMQWPHTAPQ